MAQHLKDYILYRRSLGYTDKSLRSALLLFDRYALNKAAIEDDMQPSFFLGLRKELKGEPRTVNGALRSVRGFFHFLVRKGDYPKNPLKDIPSLKELAYIPFIFSAEQIEQLLCALHRKLRKNKDCFLKDLTVYLSILLLARCGLRISEPLRLLRTHYRRQEGTLYIEKTKFKKDRLIPISRSVTAEIENYLSVRNGLYCDDHNPYLLAWDNQARLSTRHIYPTFHQAVKDIDISQPRKIIGNTVFGSPTPHSLRHSFAINTLKRIKDQGRSPQKALPILSTYMGHRKYRYTAVYLKVLDAEHRQSLVDFAIGSQEEI